jgi:uncharacterized protein YeaC (DUF1315 family)
MTKSYRDTLASLGPEVYRRFRRALELGKWPDGRVLTEAQKRACMEAIVTFETENLAPEDRVGYIDRGVKADGESCATTQPLILPDD